jgi:hypothetical protein
VHAGCATALIASCFFCDMRGVIQQYDPNKDSPRRNELKRKAQAFEEVFDTMMKRLGESDITRIVDMFQKQTLTHQAWTEAVRDQEIRVKALLDEKRNLDKQLHKLSSNKQHGVANETRQYTVSGRRLDMATERVDNSSIRLMQLEGLVAHVKESMREAVVRLQEHCEDIVVPPPGFPDEGEGGLIEVVGSYTDAVVALQPTADQYAALLEVVKTFDTYIEPPEPLTSAPASPSASKKADDRVPVFSMPKALQRSITLAADELEHSRDDPEVRLLPCPFHSKNPTCFPHPARMARSLIGLTLAVECEA